MDRPEDLSTDAKADDTNVIALEEDGDVSQENLEFSGLVAYINSQYQRSKTRREMDEERWLQSYRNYRGLYGPEVQFTDTEKSQAFIKITKTKVLASYAQIVDVLFAGSKFPIGIEPRKYPNNVADSVSFDPKKITPEKIEEKIGKQIGTKNNITRPDLERDAGLYNYPLCGHLGAS
jgi:hypothetical protein